MPQAEEKQKRACLLALKIFFSEAFGMDFYTFSNLLLNLKVSYDLLNNIIIELSANNRIFSIYINSNSDQFLKNIGIVPNNGKTPKEILVDFVMEGKC